MVEAQTALGRYKVAPDNRQNTSRWASPGHGDPSTGRWGGGFTASAPLRLDRAQVRHGRLPCAKKLLVRSGRLAAVLDFGGLAVGDPTGGWTP